jgi:hypothetical protein
MPKSVKSSIIYPNKYRKRLFKLFLTKFSKKNWLLRRGRLNFENQLNHDECEALWNKINLTLQTLN